MDSATLYECHNNLCTLGTRVTPGQFTGGATQEQVMMITGDPEAEFGEGICPNCGQPGKKTGEEFTPMQGEDPYQSLHDEYKAKNAPLAARALDASDESYTMDDYRAEVRNDQADLELAVENQETEEGPDA